MKMHSEKRDRFDFDYSKQQDSNGEKELKVFTTVDKKVISVITIPDYNKLDFLTNL